MEGFPDIPPQTISCGGARWGYGQACKQAVCRVIPLPSLARIVGFARAGVVVYWMCW